MESNLNFLLINISNLFFRFMRIMLEEFKTICIGSLTSAVTELK